MEHNPVAVVIDNNQPGRTAIIEVTIDPPTLDVGAKLYTSATPATPAAPNVVSGAVREALERIRDYADKPHADRYIIRNMADKALATQSSQEPSPSAREES